MRFLLPILLPALTVAALDAVWFSTLGAVFLKGVRPLLRMQDGRVMPDWWAAVPVYLVIALGLYVFVRPQIIGASYGTAMLWGGLFGCVSYAMYELTNKAVLAGWTWEMVVTDILWGSAVCAVAAAVLRWTMQ